MRHVVAYEAMHIVQAWLHAPETPSRFWMSGLWIQRKTYQPAAKAKETCAQSGRYSCLQKGN
jgi:hypothetical protein